tara:strand:+ start:120 stop:572 length:453 start_codon:yes stop_codon:yes gene_type:complete
MRKKCSLFIENFECPDNHYHKKNTASESWDCEKYNKKCSFNKDKGQWDSCGDCNKYIKDKADLYIDNFDPLKDKIIRNYCKKSLEDHLEKKKSLEDNLEKKKSESQKPLSGCSGYVIVEGKKQNCNECNGLISFNQYYELCKRNCTCNSE